jgi:spermidine/putrescine transport system ATP-binding protein
MISVEQEFLQARQLTKNYGDSVTACDAVDLNVIEGEFFSIVGPSGSGKTTLLRMLTGMLAPSNGRIWLKGTDITNVPPQRRPTCLVFQSLALFPHRTVGENIEFPLKMRRMKPAERRQRVARLLAQLHLPEDYYAKSVTECSGGERQRVALARALAYDPEILFFDEPLSAIDYQLRKILQRELKDIQRETGRTFVYVTHSLEEALVMSDRVGIMHKGRLEQVGTPENIYLSPATKFVAEFMGEANVLSVKKVDERGTENLYRSDALSLNLLCENNSGLQGGYLVVRPEYLRFVEADDASDNVLQGSIVNEYVLGSRIQYHVQVAGEILTVERLAGEGVPHRGPSDSLVHIAWDAVNGRLVSS